MTDDADKVPPDPHAGDAGDAGDLDVLEADETKRDPPPSAGPGAPTIVSVPAGVRPPGAHDRPAPRPEPAATTTQRDRPATASDNAPARAAPAAVGDPASPPPSPVRDPTDPLQRRTTTKTVVVKSGGVLPWIALGLVLVGALALILGLLVPLRNALEAAESDVAELRASLAEVTRQRDQEKSRAGELEAKLGELSAERAVAEQALEVMRRTQDELNERLKAEVAKGDVMISERGGELVVDLIDKIVFDSGEAELNDSGKAILTKVGDTLKKVEDKVIQVAGHTDSLNISDKLLEQFPTNWELSTARATNVVRFLQDEVKIPGKRLAAVGYSEYRPTASNKTKAGRGKNRRIEVRLLPMPKK